jgi:hypothetical protein
MIKVLQSVAGQFAEVALPATGAGWAVVDFGAAGASDATITITGQSDMLATHVPIAQVACIATADHSVDEHFVEEIEVRCGAVTPGAGFTIYVRTRNLELMGRWSIAWSWG